MIVLLWYVVATRKISDLTLLGAGQVSSSDTLLLLDNSDPTDQNKRSAVGSIFTAVPSGTFSAPGVRFEGKTSTGVFSETQGQVGLALGNSRLNLQKVGTTLNIEARDDADQNLDFKLSAQGTGKIRLGSVLAINDLNFIVPNSVDETKVAKFSSINLTAGLTNVYSFPSNEGLTNTTDELVTLKATQTLENKTIASPTFTGTLTIESFTASGSATIGDASADSLTVNAAATFAASTTFSNSLIASQGATITGDVTLNGNLDVRDGDRVKFGDDDDFLVYYFNASDQAYVSTLGTTGLTISSAEIELMNAGHTSYYFKGNETESILYHNNAARITTSATGITISGTIDDVGNVSTTGNIVATGGAANAHQLGDTSSSKLGIGRVASTYNLEVEGSIFATGSSLILGDPTGSKAIIQKRTVGLGLHFTDDTGVDQAVLDGNGNFGIGKSPSSKIDVAGDANFDGDLVVVTTDPQNKIGGKIFAREIQLIDPQTGASSTLNTTTSGGVSRAKVYFHSFN